MTSVNWVGVVTIYVFLGEFDLGQEILHNSSLVYCAMYKYNDIGINIMISIP